MDSYKFSMALRSNNERDKSQVSTDITRTLVSIQEKSLKMHAGILKYIFILSSVSFYRPSWWILCNFHAKSKSEKNQLSDSRDRNVSESLTLFCSESANCRFNLTRPAPRWGNNNLYWKKVNKQRVLWRACREKRKNVHNTRNYAMRNAFAAAGEYREIKLVQVISFLLSSVIE